MLIKACLCKRWGRASLAKRPTDKLPVPAGHCSQRWLSRSVWLREGACWHPSCPAQGVAYSPAGDRQLELFQGTPWLASMRPWDFLLFNCCWLKTSKLNSSSISKATLKQAWIFIPFEASTSKCSQTEMTPERPIQITVLGPNLRRSDRGQASGRKSVVMVTLGQILLRTFFFPPKKQFPLSWMINWDKCTEKKLKEVMWGTQGLLPKLTKLKLGLCSISENTYFDCFRKRSN